MILYIWITSVLAALYLYFKQIYSRFSRYGVNHLTIIPPFGTIWRNVFQMEHFTDDTIRSYKAFPNDRFFGKYEFLKPVVVVRDIELIKRIAVKDFEYFLDHQPFMPEHETFFGRNLFSLRGQEWKDMRSTLSPAFTSSKIRLMLPFMETVGDQMIRCLRSQIDATDSKFVDMDISDLTTRYANDVIASCAFGLKVDSHKDRDNQFYTMGRAAINFDFLQTMLVLVYASCPKIVEALKISVFRKETKEFFNTLVMDTMKDRDARHIVRPDMIQLLMEVKEGKLSHEENVLKGTDSAGFATVEESSVGKKKVTRSWSDTDLVAQAVLFFFAGFETVSSTMSFLMHELAINPDVQDRLYREIMEVDGRTGGKIDYNAIQQMTYLDMVVSELLRFWPGAEPLDRQCVKNYNLGKPNDKATEDYIIRKGEGLYIPLKGIHLDPKYFPDPEKFDPERFSEENKHKILPFTYMPFGLGPRNCIGSRFALLEVKVMAYQLLRVIEVSPCDKTQMKARLNPASFQMRILGGNWMRLKFRKEM